MTQKEMALNTILAKLIGFMFNGSYAYNPCEYAAHLTGEELSTLKSARISIMSKGSLLGGSELADKIRKALKRA